jgi:hypothetical protein
VRGTSFRASRPPRPCQFGLFAVAFSSEADTAGAEDDGMSVITATPVSEVICSSCDPAHSESIDLRLVRQATEIPVSTARCGQDKIPINARIGQSLLKRVDDRRRRQPNISARSEALRELVRRALNAEEQPA